MIVCLFTKFHRYQFTDPLLGGETLRSVRGKPVDTIPPLSLSLCVTRLKRELKSPSVVLTCSWVWARSGGVDGL